MGSQRSEVATVWTYSSAVASEHVKEDKSDAGVVDDGLIDLVGRGLGVARLHVAHLGDFFKDCQEGPKPQACQAERHTHPASLLHLLWFNMASGLATQYCQLTIYILEQTLGVYIATTVLY